MVRKYTTLPPTFRPYLPDLYDLLLKHNLKGSPYDFMAELFGISRQRAQQVVLDERRKLEGAERAKPSPIDLP